MDNKTTQEDERLRTLKLEREFQRRAEEAMMKHADDDENEAGDDDDREGEEESRDQRLHMQQKRDYRPGWSGATAPQPPPAVLPHNVGGGEPRMNGGGPEDEHRAKKVDEIRRKQQELEAASEVEERILREAQRRQEEDMRRSIQLQQQQERMKQHQQMQQMHQERYQQQEYHHQHQASQRLDTLVNAPSSSYSNGTVNDNKSGHYNHQDQQTVIPQGQPSPVPPERGSSYKIMQQQHQQTTPVPGSRSPDSGPGVKRVQFSETEITRDDNANHEVSTDREDPNVSEIENSFWLNDIYKFSSFLNNV